ncbi:MAG: hypothetical protein MJ032_02360 [Acidaminococcaceae bacterium]|nr:hypothetical protein [Acidaminococcaceae bacterium]
MGAVVVIVDPYFHYHKPIPFLYYELGNQRYVNDGIIKNFDYDALITGTSMTENFKATEVDKIFGVKSIKVPFSGGTYKELNDSIARGFKSKHKIKVVIRSLDGGHLTENKNAMRNDLGKYPTYLYDDILLNDVNYVWNLEIIRHHCSSKLKSWIKGVKGGITSFDEYSNWMKHYKFGKEYALGKNKVPREVAADKILSDKDKETVRGNIEQNVVRLASQHPETTFYYFIPPYSIVWWKDQYEEGNLKRYLQAEEMAIRQIVKCKNIKLFSFYLIPDIITNLNNYKDSTHYGEWINSKMLGYFKQDIGLITEDNCDEFIKQERDYFLNYDYKRVFEKRVFE